MDGDGVESSGRSERDGRTHCTVPELAWEAQTGVGGPDRSPATQPACLSVPGRELDPEGGQAERLRCQTAALADRDKPAGERAHIRQMQGNLLAVYCNTLIRGRPKSFDERQTMCWSVTSRDVGGWD